MTIAVSHLSLFLILGRWSASLFSNRGGSSHAASDLPFQRAWGPGAAFSLALCNSDLQRDDASDRVLEDHDSQVQEKSIVASLVG